MPDKEMHTEATDAERRNIAKKLAVHQATIEFIRENRKQIVKRAAALLRAQSIDVDESEIGQLE